MKRKDNERTPCESIRAAYQKKAPDVAEEIGDFINDILDHDLELSSRRDACHLLQGIALNLLDIGSPDLLDVKIALHSYQLAITAYLLQPEKGRLTSISIKTESILRRLQDLLLTVLYETDKGGKNE